MPRPDALPDRPGRPAAPFDPLAAHRFRTALGMGPELVARDLRVSYGLPHVGPDLVLAWEGGSVQPSEAEVNALAGTLWCSPAELLARPRTLREHRLALGLGPEDVARAVGLDTRSYLRLEERDAWRGTDRQSAALIALFGLAPAEYVTVSGQDERLAELLTKAVTTRWQGHARQIAKLVPLERDVVDDALRSLHAEYRARMATPLGRDLRDRAAEYFWAAVEKGTGEGDRGVGQG
ncbi:XRE family transcriptional regulator [Streptomyces griseoviridis]|uniref:Transcriptional regulator with XRE-family HTH domain n=1 Tax=Streptomyces griseoviridis TaxID=45398 RepID=A0ABT9LKG4_STRGD|nr:MULTISPECIES: XRE family transcriptional regulator [Streptomyces]MDP9684169.1 transcriptional regulator with XRE-family HTH domain [Streptomyces griseoviridis]GGS83851.1 DNA-binding protein [Streptomyces griseoviridis]